MLLVACLDTNSLPLNDNSVGLHSFSFTPKKRPRDYFSSTHKTHQLLRQNKALAVLPSKFVLGNSLSNLLKDNIMKNNLALSKFSYSNYENKNCNLYKT